MKIVEFEDVSRVYENGEHRQRALDHVSLQLEEGKFVVVLGPSGAGKSTLLNLLGGLDSPTEGVIRVNGKAISTLTNNELADYRAATVGFVFQSYNLIPTLTVLENVLLPSVLYRQAPDEDRALELLEKLSIRSLWDEMPSALSGGELRRMAIARALYQETPVLLADEPTGDLDEENTRIVLSVLRGAADAGKAVLLVTHEALAQDYADKVYRMEGGKLRLDDCISSRDTVK